MSLAELRLRVGFQYAARVRSHARTIMKRSGIARRCIVCGYLNHVEVCHLKAIASYPVDALVKDVNVLSNLVYLCPNHHWELDNNFLEPEDGFEPTASSLPRKRTTDCAARA